MTDASDGEDIEAIREQKRKELEKQLAQDGQPAQDGETTQEPSPSEPVHVESKEHFQEVTGDHHVVLVDFHAEWCGPCKMVEPIVADIAAETEATVAKVDIDDHQVLAREYGVQGVPTLYLFVDGQPTKRMVGVQQKGTLTNLVQQYA